MARRMVTLPVGRKAQVALCHPKRYRRRGKTPLSTLAGGFYNRQVSPQWALHRRYDLFAIFFH